VSQVTEAQDAIRSRSDSDPATRLRALTDFAKAMAAAHSLQDVIRSAAREAQHDLNAAVASISVWERDTGRLRVLVNHGRLGPGEAAFPKNESYPVSDFPAILLSEDDLGPWIQIADERAGDPKRVAMLRRRDRYCALIAPIVFNGRAWGELFAARTKDQPRYEIADVDFAAALTAQIAAGLAKADHVRAIERLAFTDQLTGLANRRAFDNRLDAAIDRHSADGTVVSLIVCDVNGLKRMNDGHGHDHGDALLVQLAGVISAAAAMLPGSLAARLGGDEFCVLIEGYGAQDAVQVAEELCHLALSVRGGEGVACGVASTGDRIGDVLTRDRLFRLADAAQYRAKRSRSLYPVVAGRTQPPDPAALNVPSPRREPAIPAGHAPDRRGHRGRNKISLELLLTEAFAALDAESARGGSSVPIVDRVEVVADVVARGLDAASWYIYRRPKASGPMNVERYSVYRTPMESGPVSDTLAGYASTALDPVLFPGTEQALRGGAFLTLVDAELPGPVELDDSAAAIDIRAVRSSLTFAQLAEAGYVGALTAGATCSDGAQWLVAVLFDAISRPADSAVPLLRALLPAALQPR
jgi:diguanylate cyclase (GGDEF)-like protein